MDAEKDPECLMLAFQIVETLAQLYPDPSGLHASIARDLFDILESYFPIHFTHVSLIFILPFALVNFNTSLKLVESYSNPVLHLFDVASL